MKKKNQIFLYTVVLFVISAALRIYGINGLTEYYTSDHPQQVMQAINVFENRSFFSYSIPKNIFAGIFSFPYGLGTIVFLYFWVFLHHLLHLPVLEWTMTLYGSLIGTAWVIGMFFLLKELISERTAFLSSVLCAIDPYLIAQCRDLGRFHIILALALGIWTLYFFIKYYKYGSRRTAIISSIFLALFIGSSNMFYNMIPVILFAGFIIFFQQNHNFKKSFNDLTKYICKFEILFLPCMILLIYFCAFIYTIVNHLNLDACFLGKPLAKAKVFGFYFLNLSEYYISNSGFIIFSIFFIGFIFGLTRFIKFKNEGILFFMALIYTWPFLFFVPAYATAVRVYIMESEIMWGILGIIAILEYPYLFPGKTKLKQVISYSIYSLIIITTFIITIGSVYNNPVFNYLNFGKDKESCGIMPYNPVGIKSVGYYVRTYIPGSKKIFSDMEPMVSNYYLGENTVFARYEADTAENIVYLKQIAHKIDYATFFYKDRALYEPVLKESGISYNILQVNYDGKPLRCLYSRFKKPLLITDNNRFNILFDQTYAKMRKLITVKIDWPAENMPQ